MEAYLGPDTGVFGLDWSVLLVCELCLTYASGDTLRGVIGNFRVLVSVTRELRSTCGDIRWFRK